MFLIGHVYTAAQSSVFKGINLAEGEGVVEIMLPDILSSHDWSYENCWYMGNNNTKTLIQAHIIGDAVVHYGDKWDEQHIRKGWAYKNMHYIVKEYNNFYKYAKNEGYLIENNSRDSLRGWAHTLIEYSIDQYLTDTIDFSKAFFSIKKAFENINLQKIKDIIIDNNMKPAKPFPQQPLRYSSVIVNSMEPDEFHLRGLLEKFGLMQSNEAINWVRSFLRNIIQDIGIENMNEIISQLINVIKNPCNFGYPINYYKIQD